jgi:hypothetical protein
VNTERSKEAGNGPDDREELPLAKAAENLLEECRMVLPGIQALFGFQLIVVFNPAFAEKLDAGEQHLHLLAIALVAVAIALVMTPAAYHRQTGPREVTARFISLSSRLLLWGMLPLAVSLSLDLYLVGRMIVAPLTAALLAGLAFAVFVCLWFVMPRVGRNRSR